MPAVWVDGFSAFQPMSVEGEEEESESEYVVSPVRRASSI